MGYLVVKCEGPRDALTLSPRASEGFDSAIVDEEMPGLKGTQLAAHLLMVGNAGEAGFIMVKKSFSVSITVLWLLIPLCAFAGAPTDAVEKEVDFVIEILRTKELTGDAGLKVKRERIGEAAGRLFDFVELSKRSLGLYWNRFNPQQRNEFVELYRKLLEDAYVGRITAYTDEKISFTKEVRLSGKIVEVRSVVATRRGDIPI